MNDKARKVLANAIILTNNLNIDPQRIASHKEKKLLLYMGLICSVIFLTASVLVK